MKRKKLMALLLTMGVILTGCGDMVGQKVGETADEILSNKENDQDAWEASDVQREDEEATQGLVETVYDNTDELTENEEDYVIGEDEYVPIIGIE